MLGLQPYLKMICTSHYFFELQVENSRTSEMAKVCRTSPVAIIDIYSYSFRLINHKACHSLDLIKFSQNVQSFIFSVSVTFSRVLILSLVLQ